MGEYLRKIRKPNKVESGKKIVFPLLILLLGIALGILSKVLDETPSNLLPTFIEYLDLQNFFSRMGVWIFIASCISIYSKTPIRAGINVILFFTGMVGSYYMYTIFIAGFFPRSYMMIWLAITLITPFLGAICWYARGTHIISIGISSVIYAIIARCAFVLQYDFSYFGITHILEFILFIASIGILYINKSQIIKVIVGGTIVFILFGYTPLVHLLV